MASIACTTVTLILVAVSMVLTYNVNNITSNLERELTIVVYFKDDATEENIKRLENDLKTMDNVLKSEFKSKDEWIAQMKNENVDLKNALEVFDSNPLLNSMVVTVKNVNGLSSTTEAIRDYDFVSSAEYGEGMVEQIVGIFDVISKGTIGMVLCLILVTAFLISNTIKLTISSRKTEIEIMRLVGASNVAIKLPFIFEGFILGVFGSIIPIVISIYGYVYLYQVTGGYLFTKILTLSAPFPFVLVVSLFLLVIGSLVGMFGSWRASRKYLKI